MFGSNESDALSAQVTPTATATGGVINFSTNPLADFAGLAAAFAVGYIAVRLFRGAS